MSRGKVLITGSSGFIGNHLATRLRTSGYDVCGLDFRPPTVETATEEFYHLDIRDSHALTDAVKQAAPDFIVHLAARTDLDEKHDLNGYSANIEGVENLVTAVAATPSVRRVLCTSSQLVCRIGYRPRSETDYAPSNLYGQSKVRTEQIWRAADGAGREWVIMRPTTIWGPGMNPHYLHFFRLLKKGKYFHIGRTGVEKSYGYVENATLQMERLLTADVSSIHRRVLYICDYEPLTLHQWSEAFRRALDAPPIRTMPLAMARAAAAVGDIVAKSGMPNFPFTTFRLNNVITPSIADSTATREICGELPLSLEDGVERTAQWLRTLL